MEKQTENLIWVRFKKDLSDDSIKKIIDKFYIDNEVEIESMKVNQFNEGIEVLDKFNRISK